MLFFHAFQDTFVVVVILYWVADYYITINNYTNLFFLFWGVYQRGHLEQTEYDYISDLNTQDLAANYIFIG